MVFLELDKMHRPECYIDVPFVDVCSWVFGNPIYDLDKPIYLNAQDKTQSLSYRQCLSGVRKLIAGLQFNGLQPGDGVCLHSFNSVWYSAVFLATIGARGRFIGSNPAHTTFEVQHLLSITKAKFLIVEPDQLDRVRSAAETCNIPLSNIFVFDTQQRCEVPGFASWWSLFDHGESDWYRFNNEQEAKNTPAMLASTSGTTGLPKAAIIPHHTFVTTSRQLRAHETKPYTVRRLLCLAQFHLFPAHLFHIAPLRDGEATYIMKKWDLGCYIDYIERYDINETAIVTPIVLALLGLPQSEQRRLQTLRSLLSAGAPLGKVDQNALRGKCHRDATFTQVWGLTEIAWATCFHYPEDDDSGSVGRLMPCNEAKIVDEDGLELISPDARGEILIRGPGLMIGYLDNPQATAATIGDGWLHTGDVGYQRDGKWYIVDRVKELIKVRGWQVSPSELEQCLLLHPAIRDAAVIGVDHEDGRGELPRAYIVVSAHSPPVTDDDILTFMHQRLARYKALAGGIMRVDVVPRNPSGKILKRILRERAAEEIHGVKSKGGDILTGGKDRFAAEPMPDIERVAIEIVG